MYKTEWKETKLQRIGLFSSSDLSKRGLVYTLNTCSKPVELTALDLIAVVKPAWESYTLGGQRGVKNFTTWFFGFAVIKSGDLVTDTLAQLPDALDLPDPSNPTIAVMASSVEPESSFLVTDLVTMEPNPELGYETAGTTARCHICWRGFEKFLPGDKLVLWIEHDNVWQSEEPTPARDWFEVNCRTIVGFNGAYMGGESDSK